MALYPEVMRMAQAEIDNVTGSERLPCSADWPNLPYVNALQLEVFCWRSVAPTLVAHRIMEDDIYDGYLIPKGSLVIPNAWKMTHDPAIYKNPMTFQPERFLGPNPEPDPKLIVFGFGRRIYPGRVMADASVFISIVMSLSVFDMTSFMKDGVTEVPVRAQMTGTVSHPESFQCSVAPRSDKAIELILGNHEV